MTKGKKIAIITVGAIVVALVVTAIILAIVQSTFYRPATKDADDLIIWVDGTEYGQGIYSNPDNYNGDIAGQDVFNGIMEKIEKSSNESVLTCVLSGAYGQKEDCSEQETALSTIKENEIVLQFIFSEEQTLKMNGEVVNDNDDNAIKYHEIYVVVSDTTDLTTTYAYLRHNTDEDTETTYRISYLSKQAELYDYIKGLNA